MLCITSRSFIYEGAKRKIAAMTRIDSSLSTPPVVVRDTEEADIAAIQSIYSHHVLTGLASFEETPPSVAEMLARRRAVLALGLPYLAAERGGRVVGYSYASSYRPRPAYRPRSRIRSMSPKDRPGAASAARCSRH